MAVTSVTSGQTVTGTVLNSGDFEYIYSGGTARLTTANTGGMVVVSSGGTASGAALAGGSQSIYAGGMAIGTTVAKGSTESIYAGATASGTSVRKGGIEVVSSGGTAIATTISGGGAESIYAGGTASGTIVRNSSTEVVSSGGTAVGTIVSSGGTESIYAGGTASGTRVGSGGTQVVSSGGTTIGTIISSGGTETISAGGMASGTMVSSGGTELIYSGGAVTGSVIMSGGIIDLRNVAFDSAGTAVLDSGTDILTVIEGGTTYTQQLAGDYSGEFFHLADDGQGGSIITEDGTPCYCRGTLILTDTGEAPVENLKIGDRLLTGSGEARPIRWIGARSYSGRFAAGNRDILPVMIAAGALADNVPKRDLWVSPLHAMYLDGVLIPAFALVNGASIVQAEAVERVEYFHLELETHDVIVAEGALAESFLDDDNRGMFQNAPEYRRLYPDTVRKPADYCAPVVEQGEEFETVRRRIAARVASEKTGPTRVARRA